MGRATPMQGELRLLYIASHSVHWPITNIDSVHKEVFQRTSLSLGKYTTCIMINPPQREVFWTTRDTSGHSFVLASPKLDNCTAGTAAYIHDLKNQPVVCSCNDNRTLCIRLRQPSHWLRFSAGRWDFSSVGNSVLLE